MALRVVLNGLSGEKCDAIFVSAILIIWRAMASAMLPTHCDNARTTAEMIQPMVETMKEVASVLRLSWLGVMRGPLLRLPRKNFAGSQGIPTDRMLRELRHLVNATISAYTQEMFDDSMESLEFGGGQTRCVTMVASNKTRIPESAARG